MCAYVWKVPALKNARQQQYKGDELSMAPVDVSNFP